MVHSRASHAGGPCRINIVDGNANYQTMLWNNRELFSRVP
jgi:hypothetical protein